MSLPEELLNSLEQVPGFDRNAFEAVHAGGSQETSIRVNPLKVAQEGGGWDAAAFFEQAPGTVLTKIPWSDTGFYLSGRPSFTFDPLFHAGCYYVQEASSMFVEQALRQTVDLGQALKVLDLCAAPGGKSTHIQSLLSADSLLVSNEVIRSRAGILKQNIIKWGCSNVFVSSNDPQHFARLEGFFDVMVVDAPCSGSGLFRKDEEAIGEWSRENVLLCCGRQKRILADAFAALKENGVLVYSTCSYSKEEDEDITDWLVNELGCRNLPLQIDPQWGIVESRSEGSGAAGYRFFPDKARGEGFYLACFRKEAATGAPRLKQNKPEKATARERAIVEPWLKNSELTLIKENLLYAVPAHTMDELGALKHALNIQYAGVAVGEIMKEKLVPEHALALSTQLAPSVARTEVGYNEAIRYLQKQEVVLETATKGWQVLTYRQQPLGWINALQNRINNYYPKEMRILKQ
ncbi:hypothetical protein V9K67_16705 [Paraflavisolibacter sp. H34]|uniref:methyltransferase RsmF C-terminal domain-like protein n=1 Tax=Huijunlia imazamoxiresistens TaxID=3127457 RepID=UPI00301B4C00